MLSPQRRRWLWSAAALGVAVQTNALDVTLERCVALRTAPDEAFVAALFSVDSLYGRDALDQCSFAVEQAADDQSFRDIFNPYTESPGLTEEGHSFILRHRVYGLQPTVEYSLRVAWKCSNHTETIGDAVPAVWLEAHLKSVAVEAYEPPEVDVFVDDRIGLLVDETNQPLHELHIVGVSTDMYLALFGTYEAWQSDMSITRRTIQLLLIATLTLFGVGLLIGFYSARTRLRQTSQMKMAQAFRAYHTLKQRLDSEMLHLMDEMVSQRKVYDTHYRELLAVKDRLQCEGDQLQKEMDCVHKEHLRKEEALQNELTESRVRCAELTTDNGAKGRQIEEMELRVTALTDDLKQSSAENAELRRQMSVLQVTISDMKRNMGVLNGDLSVSQQRMDDLTQCNSQLQADVSDARQQNMTVKEQMSEVQRELDARSDEFEGQIEELTASITELQSAVARVNGEKDELYEVVDGLRSELSAAHTQMCELQDRYADEKSQWQAATSVLESDKAGLQEIISALNEQNSGVQQTVYEAQDHAQLLQKRLRGVEDENGDLQQKLATAQQDLSTALREQREVQTTVDQLRQKISQAQTHAKDLNVERTLSARCTQRTKSYYEDVVTTKDQENAALKKLMVDYAENVRGVLLEVGDTLNTPHMSSRSASAAKAKS